jgi:hypothetical protein
MPFWSMSRDVAGPRKASMTSSKLPGESRVGLRVSLIAVGLTSVTVMLDVGAANAGMWSFSPYLIIPSLVGFLVGSSMILLAKRTGGSVEAAGVSAIVTVLLMVGGGRLLEPVGAWGVPALGAIGILIYLVTAQLRSAFNMELLIQWIAITLVLISGVSLFQIVTGLESEGDGRLLSEASSQEIETGSDIVILILDEFASPVTTPLQSSHTASLESLRGAGYEIPSAMLSAYTISSVSIPSILEGAHPLTHEDVLDKSEVLRLSAISRGQSRLVHTLKSAGYRFTQVESGLWMSACGPAVDTCIENQPLDETLGVLLNRSAFRWWYHRIWGDAFIVSGLHSMDATRRAVLDNASNGKPDLTVSHIMLPHFPYLLDEDCHRDEGGRLFYGTSEAALAAYQRQAGCVVNWLLDFLTELDEVSSELPTVLVVGDHGTNLAGQLEKPITAWSDEEIVERLAIFAAYRFPERCSPRFKESIPQLVDQLIACQTGKEALLDRGHFVISNFARPADIFEYDPRHLDEHLSASVRGRAGE